MRSVILDGGEEAVLLIHGLASSPGEMQYLALGLNKMGFTVHVPYVPGYGFEAKSTTRSRWEDWYQAILKKYERLKSRHATVSVGGLCIGAVLALRLATDVGETIAALSLLSTTLFFDGWAVPWYQFLLPLGYHTPLRHLYAYHEREPYGLKNEQLRRWVAREMRLKRVSCVGAASLTLDGLYQARRLIADVKRRLPTIKTPTLIIHAIEDDMASVRSADYVEAKIGSSQVRKILLHDSYHIITLDNEKETVLCETGRFFRLHGLRRDTLAPGHIGDEITAGNRKESTANV